MITSFLAILSVALFILLYIASIRIENVRNELHDALVLSAWSKHVCGDTASADNRDGFLYWRNSNDPLTAKESLMYWAVIRSKDSIGKLTKQDKELKEKLRKYEPDTPIELVTVENTPLTLHAPTT